MSAYPKRGRTSERDRARAGVPGHTRPAPVVSVERMTFEAETEPSPAGAPFDDDERARSHWVNAWPGQQGSPA